MKLLELPTPRKQHGTLGIPSWNLIRFRDRTKLLQPGKNLVGPGKALGDMSTQRAKGDIQSFVCVCALVTPWGLSY